jgi:CPA2 family monovalent cation:H+ antiporter-2
MAHELDLIFTLTGSLTAALILGFLALKIGLSPIVGYLLAGIVVGPFTPGFVAHAVIAQQFAELGIILLMFEVGLHFHLRDLLAVRRVAIPGALAQIVITIAGGALVTRMQGWSVVAGVTFGMAMTVASTVVLLRVLGGEGVLQTRAGHIALGWTIVEDVFTVLVVVLLPVLATQGGTGRFLVATVMSLARITALVLLVLVVGPRVVPRLLHYVDRTASRELFTLAVLVVALGIAVGAAQLFDVSLALGAFLAGMVVGQSGFSSRAAENALPMREAFAVLFFVAMGMLFDPAQLLPNLPLVLGALGVVLVGKPLAAWVLVRLLKQPMRTAVAVAVPLGQIGEFSFIVAGLASKLHLLPEAATQALVVTAMVSIALNPLAFRLTRPLRTGVIQRSLTHATRPHGAGSPTPSA